MKKTTNKIVLVGTGAVGMSFIYSAINQGIAEEYTLIDVNMSAAEGNAIDMQDAIAMLDKPCVISTGKYSDCKDADLIVITAGRPRKPGESRLDLIADNTKIMKNIAESIKASGFKGVTLIASNPCDVLTTVYQQVTGFDKHSVLGSGTNLDSARLKRLIADKLDVAPSSVNAYIMGEHGDSSVAVYSATNVMGKQIHQSVVDNKISSEELLEFRNQAINMGQEIIAKKGATFYGIGVSLCKIASSILRNEKSIYMVGAKLDGEYGRTGFYTGVPVVISSKGWERIIQWKLNDEELTQFNLSCDKLLETYKIAEPIINS